MNFDTRLEDQIRLLCDSRNRAILDILEETTETLHVEELADRLVSRDVDVVTTTAYDDLIDKTCLVLHHRRLPKLAEVGLIEYDPDANLVTPPSSAGTNVDWRQEEIFEELIAQLPIGQRGNEDGIGVVEGRKSVLEYGRQLVEEAGEEVFCMFINTDLVEDVCVRRCEDALDRGVTMYMGSQNEAVREFSRNHLPEATIWEPQLDWLNAPTYPRVGRLVLVDRRKVMLAIVEESQDEETSFEETALVGEGVENPLVVLVRELLGSRLDHLDYQSDEFQSEFHPRQ